MLPLFWLFATPQFLLPIWLDAFLTGIFWPGFVLGAFNIVLISSPEHNRPSYLAVHSIVVGFSLLLSSLIGGWLATHFSSFHLHIFNLNFINFHILFILTSFGRLLLVPMALNLAEERAQSVGKLMNLVGDKVTRTFSEVLVSSVMLISKITHRGDHDHK